MRMSELIEYRKELQAKLQQIELERVAVIRRLKAIEILTEDQVSLPGHANQGGDCAHEIAKPGLEDSRLNPAPRHAIRVSARSSLIGAVEAVARKQPAGFSSGELLKAIQGEYPEFNLKETKHISSPLSDLVKRGVLILESTKPNIYRVASNVP